MFKGRLRVAHRRSVRDLSSGRAVGLWLLRMPIVREAVSVESREARTRGCLDLRPACRSSAVGEEECQSKRVVTATSFHRCAECSCRAGVAVSGERSSGGWSHSGGSHVSRQGEV